MITYQGTGYTIYKHTNKVNGKVYIGLTKCKDLTRRWAGGHGYKECKFFFSAIVRYGWLNFEHEILETGLTKEQAAEREKFYVKEYRSRNPKYGYNIQEGGFHSKQFSKQGYKNAVANLQGYSCCPVVIFDTTGKRIKDFQDMTGAASFLGCGIPAVSSACSRGRGTCRGYIVRYAEEVEGVDQLPDDEIFKPREMRHCWRPVSCYTLDGEYVATYSSISAAMNAVGASNTSSISACVSEKQLSAYGYQWRCFDGDPPMSIAPYHRDYKKPKNAISVSQYDRFTGDKIREFETISEAALECNCHIESIRCCANGSIKTAGGYIWRKTSDHVKHVTPVPVRGGRWDREPA